MVATSPLATPDWDYAPAPESADVVSIAPRYGLFIGGEFVPPAAGEYFATLNPATEKPLAEVAQAGEPDVDRAVAAARNAYEGPWGATPGRERAKYLYRIARVIQERAREFAVLESLDNGKPIRESRDVDIPLAAAHFFYYAGWADKLEHAGFGPGPRPLGVAGQIIPWNFPLLMAAWKLAPALAAGNTCVLKPAETTPLTALLLAEVIQQADLPPGTVNILTGNGATGQALVAHPGVDKIAFTGSTQVGAEVAKAAATNITGVLLELGGKSAHLVFDDADLDAACNGVLAGVFAATGQTCMAGSRLLVSRTVHDALVEKITERARGIKLGDPKAAETEMGPVATEPQYRKVLSFLEGAAGEGATVTAGGRPDDALGGFFVQPTVLTGVKPTMTVACEEVFGPVLSVIPFDTEEEAIALANDSRYGLAGAVWTKDIHRGHRVAHAMRTGTVWINAYRVVGPDVPFGGYGLSGLGRENGIEAVHEYTQTKAIWVELTGGTRDPFTLG